jgi:hypothetical protein
MSILVRRIVICVLGILAGLFCWPVVEIIVFHQVLFPSYFIFNLVLGAACGFIIGAFFGTAEAITSMLKERVLNGALVGALIGIVGGVAGFIIGQGVLFIVGELLFTSTRNFNYIGLPLARAVGWSVLGIFIGASEGLRAGSVKKIGIGILGGFIGGLIGGSVLEYSRVIFKDVMYTRLAGLIIFGFFIGLFYSIVERTLSYGIIRVLNGNLKGKEILINQNRLRIGQSKKCELRFKDYRRVSDLHAEIRRKGNELILSESEKKAPIYINDVLMKQRILKYEDVIKIGTVKLYYNYE